MGIVTGFTADHMGEIQNACVVGGSVSGDNLLLTRFDGETITAGNVRGPQGNKGDTGQTGATGPGNATDADVAALINGATTASRSAVKSAVTSADVQIAGLIANGASTTHFSVIDVYKALVADTGWLTVPMAAGFSAANVNGTNEVAQYRIRSGEISFRGTVARSNGADFAPNSFYVVASSFPTMIAPRYSNDAAFPICSNITKVHITAFISTAAYLGIQTGDTAVSYAKLSPIRFASAEILG